MTYVRQWRSRVQLSVDGWNGTGLRPSRFARLSASKLASDEPPSVVQPRIAGKKNRGPYGPLHFLVVMGGIESLQQYLGISSD